MNAKDLLEMTKKSGKIEWDTDDELLVFYLEAAIETLERSGVPEGLDTPLSRLAACRLALHYYENPEEATTMTGQIPMGMNWMIEQLRNDDSGSEE